MNRLIRMRRFNNGTWDCLYPQTITNNVFRRDGHGVLENWLVNYDKHIADEMVHFNHVTTYTAEGASVHRQFSIDHKNSTLKDGLPILMTVHAEVDSDPTISLNGGDYKYIVSGTGEHVPGGQCSGTTMFVVYNAGLDAWVLMSTDNYTDITKVAIPSTSNVTVKATVDDERTFVVPGYNSRRDRLTVNYGQTILRPDYDWINVRGRTDTIKLLHFGLSAGETIFFTITKYNMVSRKGSVAYDIVSKQYELVAEEDGVTSFDLPAEVQDEHVVLLEFNYGQTILREGLDYELSPNWTKITMVSAEEGLDPIEFEKDDILVVRAISLIDAEGDILPRSWTPTGTYRYDIKTVRVSYTAEAVHTVVVPVPEYDRNRDELVVVLNNLVMVEGVDYEVDELSQVILADNRALNVGDTIHFTIFQGAMADVPPFNFIADSGGSGQHLVLDFSYSLLSTGFTCVVKLTHTLLACPTVKCIGGPAEAILDPFGMPVTGGYVPGTFLWLVYNQDQHVWYSMSHGHYNMSESYPAYEFSEGDSNFLAGKVYADQPEGHAGEVAIPHGLVTIPTNIDITPTEHPGVLTNPYQKPIGGFDKGTAGDNVKWMQWGLWQLGYVQKGISLQSFVDGLYNDRTEVIVEAWQAANGLEIDHTFDPSDIALLDEQIKSVYYTIGDIWTSADETYIYVGNTGNATSAFHWFASTTAAEGDIRTIITNVEDYLKQRLGNFETRTVVYTTTANNEYEIPIEDYNPNTEKLLLVNFGQTVLREGEDYYLTSTGITLRKIRLAAGSILQFTLVQQADD